MLRGDVSYGFYKNKKVPYEQFVRKKNKTKWIFKLWQMYLL